jgi:serine/threonine protein kinase
LTRLQSPVEIALEDRSLFSEGLNFSLALRPRSNKYGEVLRGIHQDTGFRVDIQVINKGLIERKQTTKTRIEREIALRRLLLHPSLIRLYDVYETSSKMYI